MEYVKGDYIYAIDEDKVYKLKDGYNERMNGYSGTMVGSMFGRLFAKDATHYRRATEDEIKQAQGSAIQHYSFWVSDVNDEIVSNGYIKAYSFERAEHIFQNTVLRIQNDGVEVGDYYLHNESETIM